MPTKREAAERDHVDKIGRRIFADALARAAMVVRSDARLTGIDKIREPLAYQAALEATGFEARPFTMGRTEIPAELWAIIADLKPKAIAAATPKEQNGK